LADLLTARQRRLLALRYGPDGLPARALHAVGAAVGGTNSSTICKEIRGGLRDWPPQRVAARLTREQVRAIRARYTPRRGALR
jgi:hypothetical protein